MAPYGRLVCDNTISPGSPLLLWDLRHNTGASHTLWALQEFLEEAIEDWMVVFDYEIPTYGERVLTELGAKQKEQDKVARAEERVRIYYEKKKKAEDEVRAVKEMAEYGWTREEWDWNELQKKHAARWGKKWDNDWNNEGGKGGGW
eukprot:gnl/TRDRNA2_/TRDRNA2_142598_c0_seq1.p1 gnl/TRDRNA2_/TRDRNA2_142598_c0~~gnl/TRDRNA2_/TRDRNA2_142598_c0_seq1.p1  ORF type:complete len:158 (-),score=46.42 gnl/TRDRNA2_/TRDRNA2_142598_c0_seq1:24-461(-)